MQEGVAITTAQDQAILQNLAEIMRGALPPSSLSLPFYHMRRLPVVLRSPYLKAFTRAMLLQSSNLFRRVSFALAEAVGEAAVLQVTVLGWSLLP